MYHALLAYAEQHGRRMTLVVPGPEDGEERLGRSTQIVRIRAPRSPVADGRYRMLLPHRFWRSGRGPLWQLLERERPDVVEVCDKYSLCFLAGLIRRYRRHSRPALVGHSCERLDDNIEAYVCSGLASRALAREVLGRVYVGMFDLHVANSEYTADELLRAMRAPHMRPVHVCPPGVELPGSPDRQLVASARRHIGSVPRLFGDDPAGSEADTRNLTCRCKPLLARMEKRCNVALLLHRGAFNSFSAPC